MLRRVAKALAPPEEIKVSQWSQKYRVLSPESCPTPGRWHNDRVPYLVEIMDCVNDEQVKEIVIMASSQVGKSECLNNILGYFVDIDPCPMLFLQPTIQLAEDYSKDRIAPMLRDTKCLRDKIAEIRSRNSSNTILHKSFPGGHFTLVGANSPASLASRPVRVVLIDEVDRMQVTAEGDPVALAEKRTINFYNSLKIKVSTPTIKNLSRIEREFKRSDQRYFHVPCPNCHKEQILRWRGVKWDKDKRGDPILETVRYECEQCLKAIRDAQRHEAIKKGRWVATAPFSGTAGFHISELYSLWRKLSDVVQDFWIKRTSLDTFQVWINTSLGEPFEIQAKSLDWEAIYQRRSNYSSGELPFGVLFLTAGIDVQSDRIHIEIVGWGRLLQTWSIQYLVVYGDTTGENVWQDLDRIIQKTWKNTQGYDLGLSKVAIDANFNTPFVHSWARQYPSDRVHCVFGRDNQQSIVGLPERLDIVNYRKPKFGLKSFPVGVSVIKQELFGFLDQTIKRNGEKIPVGLCSFPKDYTEEYFQQLTAEQLTKEVKHGVFRHIWKKIRPRNEALDCRVYARAAACLFGIDRFTEENWIVLENDYAPAIRKRSDELEIQRPQEKESIWED